jgi:type IV fimbrial biogenesis protein FimT
MKPVRRTCGSLVRQRGATLLEIVTVIAMIAVIAALAVPSFQSLVLQNRVTATVNDLSRDIGFARTQAVAMGRSVVLCVSTDQISCTGGSWQQGWIVWVDKDQNGTRDTDNEPLLRAVPAIPSSITTITASGFASATTLVFTPMGELAVGAGSFKICSPDKSVGRLLSVAGTGVSQIVKTPCGSS